METATQTAPAQPLREGQSRKNIKIEGNPTRNAYVFTVADLIEGAVKDANTEWARGGVVRGETQTLKYCSGYIPRCEIREMRTFWDSDAPNMVQETARKHLDTTYVLAEKDADGVVREVVKGLNKDGVHDGLLRQPVYPLMELARVVGQNDGTVEMPVTTPEEAALAQRFLFPNWDKIAAGEAELPKSITTLRAYFLRRQAVATAEGAQGSFFLKVAKAAVRSCDSYRTWAQAFARRMTSEYRRAERNGWPWTIGEQMEMVCEQIGIMRPDMQQQEATDKLDKITDALSMLAEIQLKREGAPDAAPPPVQEVSAPAAAPETPREAAPEVEQCMATTGTGAQCKNPAEEDGFCTVASHNAENEAKKEDARAAEEAKQAENAQ
jgi:hypothetical protein